MQDFYDLIDTYATLNNIDRAEVLHLWYRGSIGVEELLNAVLEDEGIFGYTQRIMCTVRLLGARCIKDHNLDPWKEGADHHEA